MGEEETDSRTQAGEPVSPPAGGGARESHPWRSFISWLLIVLGCLSAISGAAAVWMKVTALDTDRFVGTVAPLIQDEAVAKAVGAEAVKILLEQEDVQGSLEDVLPSELQFLAEPVTGGVRAVLEKVAEEILKSGAFQAVWRETLRQAHATAVAALTGEGEVRVTRQGEVVLDLSDLVNELKDRLVAEGVEEFEDVRIDESDASVVLFTSEELGAAKTAVDTLELLAWVLPLLALVLFAGAILVAKNHLKALMIAGIGLAVAMAVALVLLDVSKSALLNKVEDPGVRSAATVVWNGIFSGLMSTYIILVVVGVVTAVTAAVAGPYRWAVGLRSKVAGLFRRKRVAGE